MYGPDPTNPHPMEGFPQVCFIKNTVKNPNIIIGILLIMMTLKTQKTLSAMSFITSPLLVTN